MYKYYKKNNYNVMYYYFDSITEYLEHLENAKISNAFRESAKSEYTNNYNWYKTINLAEAKNMAKYGNHENFDKFLDLKLKLEKYIKLNSKKYKQYNFYVGYVPDVKAYLEGNPLSMLNKQKSQKKQINIYYNSAYDWRDNSNQIFNRGAITLSLVEILEQLGFSVSLNFFVLLDEGKQVHYSVFKLKNINERINIQKLFFPMCHPSWFRRLYFKLMETTPDINFAWCDRYGVPSGENMIRKIIDLEPNDIVICEPRIMNIYGNDIIEDANNMFDYINDGYKTKDFELPSFEKTRKI